jgi:hypothetical protein
MGPFSAGWGRSAARLMMPASVSHPAPAITFAVAKKGFEAIGRARLRQPRQLGDLIGGRGLPGRDPALATLLTARRLACLWRRMWKSIAWG